MLTRYSNYEVQSLDNILSQVASVSYHASKPDYIKGLDKNYHVLDMKKKVIIQIIFVLLET